jgi:hypothetical protein
MLALICLASLRWQTPKTNPAENASQAGRPCAILTAHVSILSEHKALIGFSAYLDQGSGIERLCPFLPRPLVSPLQL